MWQHWTSEQALPGSECHPLHTTPHAVLTVHAGQLVATTMSASGEPSPPLPSPPLPSLLPSLLPSPLSSPSLSLPSLLPCPSPLLLSVLQGCADDLARYQNVQLSIIRPLGLFSGLLGVSSTNRSTQPLPFPPPLYHSLPLPVPLPPFHPLTSPSASLSSSNMASPPSWSHLHARVLSLCSSQHATAQLATTHRSAHDLCSMNCVHCSLRSLRLASRSSASA